MGPSSTVLDVLGEPYVAETLELPADDEGECVATLVSRRASPATHRAVLHVHGFNDYFFQTVAADFWVSAGYDFYALDLRKYGRSLRPHQTPNFVTDLADYFVELDAALDLVCGRDGHTEVVVSAHSTGGLVTALWLDAGPSTHAGSVRALVLNSPWLELHGPLWLRTAGTQVIDRVGARRPDRELPRSVTGLYGRSATATRRSAAASPCSCPPSCSAPTGAATPRCGSRTSTAPTRSSTSSSWRVGSRGCRRT